MRLSALALLSLFLSVAATAAEAQTTYRHPDGSVAYSVPEGIESIPPVMLVANQAFFAVHRPGDRQKTRTGICVLAVKTLSGPPNLPVWNAMIAAHRTDTEAKARADLEASSTFVRLGGYRDLKLSDGDGYAFWYQRSTAGGEQTKVSISALMRPQSLLTGYCTSNAGVAFSAADIDRVLKLVASARRP